MKLSQLTHKIPRDTTICIFDADGFAPDSLIYAGTKVNINKESSLNKLVVTKVKPYNDTLGIFVKNNKEMRFTSNEKV